MSDVLMVIATIFIAVFSGISCLVAYRIHQSTQKRDSEIKNILEQLVAATLASGPGIGESETMAKCFKEQLNAIRKLEY